MIVLPWWVSVPLGIWLAAMGVHSCMLMWDEIAFRIECWREDRRMGGNGED